jgi:hypothetical protein
MVCFVEYEPEMRLNTHKRFDPERLSRPTLTELLEAMSPVLRRCMLEHFTPTCCIGTCRILIEVLAYYRFSARAVPTTVFVYNAAMIELLGTGVEIPEAREDRIVLFDQTGAWGVGVAPDGEAPDSGGKFGGHLVVQCDGLLIDGSIQQAQRTERNIVLPSLLWFKPTPAGFFSTRVKGQTTRGMLGDCMLVYRRLENPGYLDSPNWRQKHAGVPEVFRKVLTLTALGLERAHVRPETASDASARP